MSEGFESGTLGLFGSSGTPGWITTTTHVHTGLYAAYAPDLGMVTDLRLTLSTPIPMPPQASQVTLNFYQQYDFESPGSIAYDGGVLEASTDGGSNWDNPFILSGGYNAVLYDCPSLNPLAGQAVWSGTRSTWQQVVADLTPYLGRNLIFRFRLGTDQTGASGGWWIDDISVVVTNQSCYSPTATGTATDTPTPTGTRPTGTYTRTPTVTRTPTCVPIFQDVRILSFAFDPQVVAISAGSSIRWTNFGNTNHTATSDTGVWNSGNLTPGQVYSFMFNSPGTYPYHCTIHPSMTGTIVVRPSCVGTPTATGTATRTPLPTYTATLTSTPCAVNFSDVQPGDYFFAGVRWLYCNGAISGYDDGTFRPYNNITRGQLTKIVVLTYGFPIYTPPIPTFQDVPTTDPFYIYIETAYHEYLVSGYSCGTNCLEFRPGALITRGQLTKVIVNAARWYLGGALTPHFSDVPTTDVFFMYIETAYCHQAVSGYSCGTNCLEFRPSANATRGQVAKMVYNAVLHLSCVPLP